MNEFMKILLSLSVSGTLLLLPLLGLKPLYKNRFSRHWQYYIWIIVILRYLLPFAPKIINIGSLLWPSNPISIANEAPINETPLNEAPTNKAPINEAPTNEASLNKVPINEASTNEAPASPNAPITATTNNNTLKPAVSKIPAGKGANAFIAGEHSIGTYAYICLFFAWSVPALLLLARKAANYRRFIRFLKAGRMEVSDIKALNLLADCKERQNIKARVELCRHPSVTSPIMVGFFRPTIVLPVGELEPRALTYIFTHELLHYKRQDMFYKWLVQIAISVHWFNPFIYLLEKEVNQACELSCDEAVIASLGKEARREYGDTLIHFLKPNDPRKSSFVSVTLTEGAKQLKERLGAIMNFKKKSKAIQFLMGVLTLCVIFGAAFFNIYPAAAKPAAPVETNKSSVPGQKNHKTGTYIYDEGSGLGRYLEESPESSRNQKENGQESNKREEEDWDENGRDDDGRDDDDWDDEDWDWDEDGWDDDDWDWDEDGWDDDDWDWDEDGWDDDDWDWDEDGWDDEDWDWDEESLIEEYAAHGIQRSGKRYYYNGELVYIIKDQRPDSSFYLLDINSKGTASIKVLRDKEGKITGVSEMSEEEITELLERAVGEVEKIPAINTMEWDSPAFLTLEAYYETDQLYLLPSPTDKIILKEYLTEDSPNYYAAAEIKNSSLIIRSGDRPAGNYKSYIEIYVPDHILNNIKVETVSGTITVEDYAGAVSLSTTSGSINIFDSKITGSIQTVSGSISLFPAEVPGDLSVYSHSGDIYAFLPASARYHVKAETATGEMNIRYLDTYSK